MVSSFCSVQQRSGGTTFSQPPRSADLAAFPLIDCSSDAVSYSAAPASSLHAKSTEYNAVGMDNAELSGHKGERDSVIFSRAAIAMLRARPEEL